MTVEEIPTSEITVPTNADNYTVKPFALKYGNIVTLGCTVHSGTINTPFAGRDITFPDRVRTRGGVWYCVAGVDLNNNDVKPGRLDGKILRLPPSDNLRNLAVYTITYIRE